MPVLVDPKACVDREHCFAAAGCPYDAYFHNSLKKAWDVDANICGDCPGPCLNFCDKDAVHWGDDLVDLKLVKAQLDGTMKPDEIAIARRKHKEELKLAEEAAKRKSAEGVLDLTRANFEREVLRAQVPVVVDCWAAWCGPCKQFSPIFEALAKQYVGIVKFAKLDTDAEPALAQGLGVSALPTTLMFFRGQLINGAEGALSTSQLQTWIYQTLTVIRQYESQLAAEAEEAIGAATQNVSALDGDPRAGQQEQPTSPPDLILDSRASTSPPTQRRPGGRDLGGPGKQTSSGLYIP